MKDLVDQRETRGCSPWRPDAALAVRSDLLLLSQLVIYFFSPDSLRTVVVLYYLSHILPSGSRFDRQQQMLL